MGLDRVDSINIVDSAVTAAKVAQKTSVFKIDLSDIRKAADLTLLPRSPDGTNLTVEAGAHGAAAPYIRQSTLAATTWTGRFLFALPANYVAGQAVTIRVRAKKGLDAWSAATVDLNVYASSENGVGGISADLCATDAQAVAQAVADKDFTITAAALVAGTVLDVKISFATASNDHMVVPVIAAISVLCVTKL